MDFPQYKPKKSLRRPRQVHLHHTSQCTQNCECEDCYCRDIPLDQRDDDDED